MLAATLSPPSRGTRRRSRKRPRRRSQTRPEKARAARAHLTSLKLLVCSRAAPQRLLSRRPGLLLHRLSLARHQSRERHRALRRKLSQRIRAATRVIDALTKNPGNSSRINEEVARLSKIKKEDETKEAAQKAREEERCRARDEKEAEKNKLAQLKAEALKIKEQERKEREKEKENEKLKKAEVMKERTAAKVEKEKAKAEADRLKAEAEKAASAKLQKQRNMMMGFFKKKSPQVCKDAAEEKKELERGGVAVVKVKSPPAAEPKARDSDAFWSEISGDGDGDGAGRSGAQAAAACSLGR